MDSLCKEPVCLWLTPKYKKAGTSTYVQGVEVGTDYDGVIPDGFDVITLPQAEYLMFQGEPFCEEDYCEAIEAVQKNLMLSFPVEFSLLFYFVSSHKKFSLLLCFI